MTSLLASLQQHSLIVADTGDIEAIARWRPRDATTNPSLLLAASTSTRFAPIVEDALQRSGGSVERAAEWLCVLAGKEILRHVQDRVSTEVDARCSFDTEATVATGRRLVERYGDIGVPRERVLVKIAATWEGIRAAALLEREGIRCNLTLLFSFAQAVACADAGVTLISPFVGRIYDWHKAARRVEDIPVEEDPGVSSVVRIYDYFKHFGYPTQVMAASFRKASQVVRLAGCDLLTISPDLLAELAASEGEVTRQLSAEKARAANPGRVQLDEPAFRWAHNEDAMATDKLSEGIRRFDADARKLDAWLRSRLAGRRAA